MEVDTGTPDEDGQLQQQHQEAPPPDVHHASLAFENSGKPFSCSFAFCKDSEQGDLLPSKVRDAVVQATLIHSTWGNRKDVNVLQVLHVAHGGGPVLHALPDPEQGPTSSFEAQHLECLEHHTALVIQLDAAHELMLAPVRCVEGDGSVVPVFWGYVLCPGMASVAFGLLERRQMALIFDLDETLVVAHTLSTAESRRDECQYKIPAACTCA
ncbi:hypothetical protein DUNSADRAFT_6182 [Dunaliella salina]|uniref:Protein-serine/threonine phosphatase n=1 Tax=Dunaliella salina TaxID=3046 RepID=A0ABQ7GNU0_DUNSA|nr:hypothetical protein DUNSADRAFT_6182 [Dunaliella salina]|eukprot:KAF5836274.1 hypothetical protein DUNSADRAFT_6182 [Dunaliella salina]